MNGSKWVLVSNGWGGLGLSQIQVGVGREWFSFSWVCIGLTLTGLISFKGSTLDAGPIYVDLAVLLCTN